MIRKGELILVEDKVALMAKLGRKQLTVELRRPLDALPPALAGLGIELAAGGGALVHRFDAQREDTGIAALLRRLDEEGIEFTDLRTAQSSLEDIFVGLVAEPS